LGELEAAMKEADENQVVGWGDFKSELAEWRKK
jgi:hypothetical protein